jgi:hypothetical protein
LFYVCNVSIQGYFRNPFLYQEYIENRGVYYLPFCRVCASYAREDALYCPNCGSSLAPAQPLVQFRRRAPVSLVILGYVSAAIGLYIFPEIFSLIAVVLGFYLRRRGRGNGVLALGLLSLLLGFIASFYSLLLIS